MFEEYLQDAYDFFLDAQSSESRDSAKARRFYRASVFHAAGSLEAFVFYIVASFREADRLPKYELAFLSDSRLVYNPESGELVEKKENHGVENKLKVLIRRFNPDFNFGCREWANLCAFRDFRHLLIHPEGMEDIFSLDLYRNKIKVGLNSILFVMNMVSTSIFEKPLRRKLLDLTPD